MMRVIVGKFFKFIFCIKFVNFFRYFFCFGIRGCESFIFFIKVRVLVLLFVKFRKVCMIFLVKSGWFVIGVFFFWIIIGFVVLIFSLLVILEDRVDFFCLFLFFLFSFFLLVMIFEDFCWVFFVGLDFEFLGRLLLSWELLFLVFLMIDVIIFWIFFCWLE